MFKEAKIIAKELVIKLEWIGEMEKETWRILVNERKGQKIEREVRYREQYARKVIHQVDQSFDKEMFKGNENWRGKCCSKKKTMLEVGNINGIRF